MTLKRRTDLLAQAARPMSARERRHARRLSGQAKVVRWIGASKTRRVSQAAEAVATPAGAPAQVIVLSWKQLFGRGLGAAPSRMPDRVPPMQVGSKLLAFRSH